MKKVLITIVLFIFFISFISATGCRIHEDDLKIVVGVYDKTQEDNKFVFEKSRFQPNDDKKIVQVGEVLIIESFNIKVKSSCRNLINETKEKGIKIAFILPNETHLSESIYINLNNVNFQEKEGFFEYSFNLTNISRPETREDLDYHLEYIDLIDNLFILNYVTLDKAGEWEILAVGENPYRENIFNEGGYFRKINVLDRVDVAQLEVLDKIREDSKKSSNWSLFVVIIIGLASILFMWIIPFCIERQKQKSLLKSLLVELNKISNGKKDEEGNLQWFSKTIQNFHGIWILNVSVYMNGLNGFENLKKNLVGISQKIEMLNRINNLGLRRGKFFKGVINETITQVEESKGIIEEKYSKL